VLSAEQRDECMRETGRRAKAHVCFFVAPGLDGKECLSQTGMKRENDIFFGRKAASFLVYLCNMWDTN
jgi:hypothetical protein